MPKLTNQQKREIATAGAFYDTVDINVLVGNAKTELADLRQMLFDDRASGAKYEEALTKYLALNYAILKRDKEKNSRDFETHKQEFSLGLDDVELSEKEVGDFFGQMEDPEFDPLSLSDANQEPEAEAENPVKEQPKAEAAENKAPLREEPKKDEPKMEEQKKEEPKKDEPSNDEPTPVTIEEVPDYHFPEIVSNKTTHMKYMVFMNEKFNNSRNYAAKPSDNSFLKFAAKFAESTKKTTENAKNAYEKSITENSIAGNRVLNSNHAKLENHEANCLRGLRPMLHDQYKRMSFFRNPIDKLKCFFLMKKIDNRIQKVNPGVDKKTLDKDLNAAQRFFNTQPGEVKVKDVYTHPEQTKQAVLKEQAMFSRQLSREFEKEQLHRAVAQQVKNAPERSKDFGPKKD